MNRIGVRLKSRSNVHCSVSGRYNWSKGLRARVVHCVDRTEGSLE